MIEVLKSENGHYKLYLISTHNHYRPSPCLSTGSFSNNPMGDSIAQCNPPLPVGDYIVAASMEEALQAWREKPGTVNKKCSPALIEVIGVVTVVK